MSTPEETAAGVTPPVVSESAPVVDSTAKKIVRLNVHGVDKGTMVEVWQLGMYPNGQDSEVSEANLATYEALGNTFPASGVLEVPGVLAPKEEAK